MNRSKVLVFLPFALGMLYSVSALAEQPLGLTRVRELFNNKTIEAYNVDKGYYYRSFFSETGEAVIRRLPDGKKYYGVWRVDDKGRHCVKRNSSAREYCSLVFRMGPEMYKKVTNGDHSHTIRFIYSGNRL